MLMTENANTAYHAISSRTVGASSKRVTCMKLLAGLAIVDLVMITIGMTATSLLYLGRLNHERLETFLPLVLPVYFLIAVRQRAFNPTGIINRTQSASRSGLAFLLSIAAVILMTFLAKASAELSRGLLLAGGAASFILLLAGRAAYAELASNILHGSPESEVVLIDGLQPPPECTALKVDLRALSLTHDIHDPAMLDRLGKIIRDADRVIVCCEPDHRARWSLALKGAGMNVEVLAPELDEIGAISPRTYCGTATALVATGPLNPVDRMTKRAFDLALTIPAVILLSPLLLAVAIIIKLDSPGSALFKQNRVGKGNRMFAMYKFRSMRTDRSDHNASQLTTRNDARVTRVGKFIRATSIDELPQLFNVILGDMSIVGPRPHATGALAGDALYWEVSSHYWSRHAVKPGLTGLAQVKGFRGNTETGDDLMNRLQADLDYLDNWSIWRDVMLVMRTFGVLVHRNAF